MQRHAAAVLCNLQNDATFLWVKLCLLNHTTITKHAAWLQQVGAGCDEPTVRDSIGHHDEQASEAISPDNSMRGKCDVSNPSATQPTYHADCYNDCNELVFLQPCHCSFPHPSQVRSTSQLCCDPTVSGGVLSLAMLQNHPFMHQINQSLLLFRLRTTQPWACAASSWTAIHTLRNSVF